MKIKPKPVVVGNQIKALAWAACALTINLLVQPADLTILILYTHAFVLLTWYRVYLIESHTREAIHCVHQNFINSWPLHEWKAMLCGLWQNVPYIPSFSLHIWIQVIFGQYRTVLLWVLLETVNTLCHVANSSVLLGEHKWSDLIYYTC